MADRIEPWVTLALQQAEPAAILLGAYLRAGGADDSAIWRGLPLGRPEPWARLAPPTDDLGRLAELLARGGERPSGAHFTPAWLVDHALDLAEPHGPVLDPACGAGAFLLGCLRRGLAPRELWGTDSQPLLVAACRMALALAGAPADVAATQVILADGLTDPHPLDGRWRSIVGNPPWGLRLDPRQREALLERLGPNLGPARGEPCTAALFTASAAGRLAPAGRLTFVLPESWLSTRRAEPFRRWLLTDVRPRRLDVLRKNVFASAPDIVPVVLSLEPLPAKRGTVAVRQWGLRRPTPTSRPTTWSVEAAADPDTWLAEPYAVFALGADLPRFEATQVLGDVAAIHDGIYKTRLAGRLGEGGPGLLTRAAQVRRFEVEVPGQSLSAQGFAALPAAEQRRMLSPKVLLHAMRKPALADRLVAAADRHGVAISNNLVAVIPRPGRGWTVDALAALLNSRVVNRWYAERFIQVNIEAFALAGIPLPEAGAADRELLDRLGRAADGVAVERLLDRLYDLDEGTRRRIDAHWAD